MTLRDIIHHQHMMQMIYGRDSEEYRSACDLVREAVKRLREERVRG